jgi:hypothetical protein
MSAGVNKMAALGVTKAVGALMDMLMLTITGVEEIALFIINLLTSTYVCLITLVIGGAMHAALEVIEKAGEFVNKTIAAVTGEITDGMESFESGMNDFLSTIGDISGFFGGSKDPPTIDLTTQINKLNSINLDTADLNADLAELESKIPTFEDVHNFTNSLIRSPFEDIKKLINESISGYEFDQSVFPVAQKEALTFCSDNNGIASFFDGLAVTADTAKKVFIGVVVALALLACAPMAWREIKRWRLMQQRAALVHKQAFDPLDVIYLASRPYTSTAGIKVASRFKSTRKQVLVRWFVAYITSVPALFVLMLALAGFISCLFQFILLKTIQKEVPALASQVGDFSGHVVLALNNASEQWAVGANSVIVRTNDEINSDVFGWVNTSTTSVNKTLNTFVDMTQKTLNDTFGGTILYDPIQEVLKCLIFLKVQGIQKGLTWVHDHAHVNFPQFDKDVFSLGAAAAMTNSTEDDSFLASPGSESTDEITGAVDKVINFMNDAIQEEVWISSALLGLYLIICLIGLTYVLFAMMKNDKTRAEGGPVYNYGKATGNVYTGEFRSSVTPRGSPKGHGSAAGKFPTFGREDEFVTPTSSQTTDVSGGLGDEKVRDVKSGRVGKLSTGAHGRKSSYGFVGEKI